MSVLSNLAPAVGDWEDAKREKVWLRMLLMGPTGSGKTMAALEVATKLFDGSFQVVVGDSEHGRAKLYSDQYAFKWKGLERDFSPEAYIDLIDDAERRYPGGVLILDSISHEWMGANGVLQQADRFGDWKQIRPRHTSFIERILETQMHVIVTVRSKMKYEVETVEVNGRDKQVIRKLGLGPIQDDSLPYEFDVIGAVDPISHDVTFSNRCSQLVDLTLPCVPGDEVAAILSDWLSQGDPPVPPEAADPAELDRLVQMLLVEGHGPEKIEERLTVVRRQNRGVIPPQYVGEQIGKATKRLAAKEPVAS